jgi:hypothetical protein
VTAGNKQTNRRSKRSAILHTNYGRLIAKWKEGRIEVMYLSEENCIEILRILQRSMSVFPLGRQSLNKMNVGFLRRIC